MCCGGEPDTSGINYAAIQNAELGKEALAWYKERYAAEAPTRQAAEERANEVAGAQVDAMNEATRQARELYDYNKETYRPLEQQLVADAQGYDTQARRSQEAAAAAAEVDASFSGVEGAMARAIGRSGGSVDGGRALIAQQDAAIAQALGRAAAGTQAVRNVEQQGYARRMDAASLGRGLPAQQATQQQIATQAGGAAIQSGNAAIGASQAGNATMGAGFDAATRGYTNAGNLYSQAAKINADASGDMMGNIMQLAGTAAALYFSSRRMKRNTGKAADPEKSLKAIEQLKVKDGWEYDPKKGGPADGKKHTGPMAEDVQKRLGSDTSNGTMVDAVDMDGHLIAAIQAMSKRVKKLEARA